MDAGKGERSPGADAAGGAPSPSADVAGVGPVPVQVRQAGSHLISIAAVLSRSGSVTATPIGTSIAAQLHERACKQRLSTHAHEWTLRVLRTHARTHM